MHVLGADGAAVGFLQETDDGLKGHRGGTSGPDDFKRGFEIGFGQSDVAENELGGGPLPQVERIDLGLLVAETAIGTDERIDLALLLPLITGGRCGRAGDNGRSGFAIGGLGELLAAQLKAGEKSAPLGIDTGGIPLPLGIKGIEFCPVIGGGGIGTGNGLVIQGQADPTGHDGHRIEHHTDLLPECNLDPVGSS